MGNLMGYESFGPARVLRRAGDGLVPVGPTLEPIADDALHHPTVGDHAYWTLPSVIGARAGDVLVAHERAWALTGRCSAAHPASRALRDHILGHYDDPAWAAGWLSGRDVWSVTALPPGWTPRPARPAPAAGPPRPT